MPYYITIGKLLIPRSSSVIKKNSARSLYWDFDFDPAFRPATVLVTIIDIPGG